MLGITHASKSPDVERALTDFGAEESFGRAVKRFKEAERLQEVRSDYKLPIRERPGVDVMLVELDGCEIRTGTLVAQDVVEKTAVRGLDKRKRNEEWRDVRLGFARPLGETRRTYVGAMAEYDVVGEQLFSAAVDRGLSEQTQVVAVADGGNGLRECLDAKFPGLRFVLDRPHFKSHVYEAADAMGLIDGEREEWVAAAVCECEVGHASTVVQSLRSFVGGGDERVHRLAAYLDRFKGPARSRARTDTSRRNA